MSDVKELIENELEKVTGGTGYTSGNTKPQGYAFYTDSSKNTVYKVCDSVRFINNYFGYEYTIDCYYYGEYMGRLGMNLYDYDIDNYVANFGRPE